MKPFLFYWFRPEQARITLVGNRVKLLREFSFCGVYAAGAG